MHYVDEGPAGAETVLLLHGQPTWSYLYRTVVARLAGRGLRAVAPDLIGFGRSDKPRGPDGPLGPGPRRLDGPVRRRTSASRDLTLVVQDWGGPIGLGVLSGRARPGPPGRGRQHRVAHRRPRAGRTAGMGLPRRPGRHGHRGADAARLPAPDPGAHAVPAQPLRAGGHRVGGAGRRSWRPTTPRSPTRPSAPGPASSPC